MDIEVWDDDTFSDDVVGRGSITIQELYKCSPNKVISVSLSDDDGKVGTCTFKVRFPPTIEITPVKAFLKDDSEIFGKIEPYCIVKVGPQKY